MQEGQEERPDSGTMGVMTQHLYDTYGGVALIDTAAIAANVRQLRAAAPDSEHMVIVKANAYGHGLALVARAAIQAGTTWFGAAQLTEAMQIRKIVGKRPRIFSWIFLPGSPIEEAVEADIDLSVSDFWALDRLEEAAEKTSKIVNVHLKIDTGMSRAGATARTWPALCEAAFRLEKAGKIRVVAVWSHLSRADEVSAEGKAQTKRAGQEFAAALAVAKEAGLNPELSHLSATAATLWHPELHTPMVRDGIGVYGLSPDERVQTNSDLALRPAMRLQAGLTVVKKVEAGRPVSYGGTWVTPSQRWLAVAPLGYGDGIARACDGARVRIKTKDRAFDAPIVGRICMDQVVLDLGEGEHAPAEVGDDATLLGDGSDGEPTARDWANWTNTINYEVVTRVGARVPRIDVKGRQDGDE